MHLNHEIQVEFENSKWCIWVKMELNFISRFVVYPFSTYDQANFSVLLFYVVPRIISRDAYKKNIGERQKIFLASSY